jgi:hypothetical protein
MPTTDLMALLQAAEVTFILRPRQEMSGTAGGDLLAKDLGPALWDAKLRSGEIDNDIANQIEALVDGLDGSLGTFYVWNPKAQGPASDPSGAILGASTVKIKALDDDDATVLQLKGLPAAYVLTRGDMLSFDWGSRPSRALHRIVSASVTADVSGNTGDIVVRPPIRPGAEVDDVVTLIRSAAEMRLVPGSFDAPSAGPTTSTISLEAVQVI